MLRGMLFSMKQSESIESALSFLENTSSAQSKYAQSVGEMLWCATDLVMTARQPNAYDVYVVANNGNTMLNQVHENLSKFGYSEYMPGYSYPNKYIISKPANVGAELVAIRSLYDAARVRQTAELVMTKPGYVCHQKLASSDCVVLAEANGLELTVQGDTRPTNSMTSAAELVIETVILQSGIVLAQ